MKSTEDIMQSDLEKSLIFDCLRAFINGTVVSTKDWNNRSLLKLNWEWIIETARTGRILSFLIHIFEQEGYLRFFVKKDRLKWKSFLMNSEWENRKKMTEFKKIKDLFEIHSIPLIPLKGIALSCLVYDKAPYRFMSDIDILIRETDLQKTKEILSKDGFVLSEPKNRWQAKPTMEVIGRWSFIKGNMDLDLQWSPKFFFEDQLVSWDCGGAWQRAESFKRLGDNVFMLTPVDQALYLSFQILNDMELNSVHMIQLLDLALIMEKFGLDSDCIVRNASNLKFSLRNKLSQFLQSIEVCFFKDHSYSRLPQKYAEFFDRFFEFSPVPHHNFALKRLLWLIQSPWERILFFLGYFIPSQSVLRKKTSLSFFPTIMFLIDHWKKQCLLFFKLLLKQR